MRREETTWGSIWKFGYVEDATGAIWKILLEKAGWLRMRNQAGEVREMLRPEPERPVAAWTLTEEEALAMLLSVFPGAKVIQENGVSQ